MIYCTACIRGLQLLKKLVWGMVNNCNMSMLWNKHWNVSLLAKIQTMDLQNISVMQVVFYKVLLQCTEKWRWPFQIGAVKLKLQMTFPYTMSAILLILYICKKWKWRSRILVSMQTDAAKNKCTVRAFWSWRRLIYIPQGLSNKFGSLVSH